MFYATQIHSETNVCKNCSNSSFWQKISSLLLCSKQEIKFIYAKHSIIMHEIKIFPFYLSIASVGRGKLTFFPNFIFAFGPIFIFDNVKDEFSFPFGDWFDNQLDLVSF